MANSSPWGKNKGFRQISRLELPGAGKVTVNGNYAYLGHMRPPDGTTILDISDPKNPKVVHQIDGLPPNVHTHKVRVEGDLMVVNHEMFRFYKGPEPPHPGGLAIYDISNPSKPKQITFFEVGQWGYHNYSFDGRYVYGTPTPEGYVGNIMEILDLQNPEKPDVVSRWWVEGQWVGGGEEPIPEARQVRCHLPLRMGDRLYSGWWHKGWYIHDISDLSNPKPIVHMDWSPPFPCPTHTALPIPHDIKGRRILVVNDEEVADRLAPVPNAFLFIVDVTDETNPVPISTYRAREDDEPFDPKCWYGCHQPQEQIYGNQLAVTWFAGGLRMIDISDPWKVKELGYYIPDPGKGYDVTQSNDVYATADGLYYLVDRLGGFEILEWVG
jgi:hypothetical protein